jgi:uncharacterized protein (TIGR01777 family)
VRGVRVVVAGGTGFVGRRLVRALALRGDSVAVLTRGSGGTQDAAELVSCDYGDAAALAREVARADAVVNLAGASVSDGRWSPARLALVRSSRVDVTAALARALAGAGGAKVLVSGSAVGIYGMRLDEETLDEQGAHGTDVLAEVVEAWEAAAEPARAAGVRVAFARIGIVLGAEAGALAKMLGPFRWFVGGPVGSGKQYLSWIHAHDCVRALLFALDTAGFEGPFNVTAPTPVTMDDLARALGRAMGRPAAFRVPAFALKLAVGGFSQAVLTGQRAVPGKLVGAGFRFEHPDLVLALQDLLAKR